MVGKLRTKAKSATQRLRPGRTKAASAEPGGGQKLVVRRDPLPDLEPPPAGLQHVVLVEGVPVDYGGRTASILAKCRTLYAEGGMESVILVRNHSPRLHRAVEAMRTRGHLGEGVRVVSLQDAYPDPTEAAGPDPRATDTPERLEEQGWLRRRPSKGRDGALELTRYDEGVLTATRRYEQGRLAWEDHYDPARNHVSREEFSVDGRRTRSTFWDLTSRSPRQHVYYRHNGRPMFAHAMKPPAQPGGWVKEDGATTFDVEGRPETEHSTLAPVLHRALDAVTAGRPTVLTVEARVLDREALSYQRPHVVACYVLHTSHLEAPGDDLGAIRPSFARILSEGARESAPPTVVFLTDTQRAEAEAHLGERASFGVIPHASPPPRLDPELDRDPDLVVMMGRLVDEKRVDHGIRAFAQVLTERPQARLEIYGEGPHRGKLERLVRQLRIGDSVRLAGFTTDPGREFQRASLCLLTSRYEGAPMTLVEALVHGCPVISYDIRYGPADIIEDGVNGFLVPPGDIDQLAARMLQALSDTELSAALRDGCRRAEERFGQRAFAARWFDLFRRIAPQIPAADADRELR